MSEKLVRGEETENKSFWHFSIPQRPQWTIVTCGGAKLVKRNQGNPTVTTVFEVVFIYLCIIKESGGSSLPPHTVRGQDIVKKRKKRAARK
jgi:hypothetical protein